MRFLYVLLLGALSVAAALAWLVRLDAGYVLLQFRGTQVETTVWFALFGLTLAVILFYYAARALLIVLDRIARGFGHRPSAPRYRRGRAARAAKALGEGRWSEAARLLAADARDSGAPLLNYLLAADAAERAGDAALARGFLALAGEIPGAQAVTRIARAAQQMRAGEHAAALATIDEGTGALEPAAIDLLLNALPALGEWSRLAEILPEARRLELRTPAVLDALEERSFRGALDRSGSQAAADVRTRWRALPAAARANPALIARQTRALSAAGAGDEALVLLEEALARGMNPVLLAALGQVRASDPARALSRAEKLLARHPNDADLLLAAGRLALAAQLWGKARDYFDASLARAPRVETYAELARVCDRLGDGERARALRERALALTLPEQQGS